MDIFNYEGKELRTAILNDEVWFVAKDVCEVLELDATQTRRLDEDEKGLHSIQTLGGQQNMLCVNESGLYSLVLGSRKKEAKAFKRWITHEVLPSIRKTGSYSSAPKPQTQAELMLMYAQQFVVQEQRLNKLEEQVTIANHRIDTLDAVNVVGDMQQRLNGMIRRYANDRGIQFPQAYRDFRTAYNTAYHTNITMLIENYKLKHGIKRKVSAPEYLEATGKIEDGLRVADKMLNQSMVASR